MSKKHEEVEVITLIDEDGNEALYEVLFTIDGQEKFGKNYVLMYPSGIDEEENVGLLAYSFVENADGTQGELTPIDEDSNEEWDMIEEVFQAFLDEED
ncbi:MAG: DUF1292 domain-containing protein [Lactobacillales bacterium]|nr:DUF1292 domain-containing protein [Lactobacillales bacterium]